MSNIKFTLNSFSNYSTDRLSDDSTKTYTIKTKSPTLLSDTDCIFVALNVGEQMEIVTS